MIKRLLQSPRWITVFMILLALAAYAWLARGQGAVVSLAFSQEDGLYVGAGRHGGVVVLTASIREVYEKTLTPSPTLTESPTSGHSPTPFTETPTPTGPTPTEGKAKPTASATQGPSPTITRTPTITLTPTFAPTMVVTYNITKAYDEWGRFDTPGNARAVVPYSLEQLDLILVADEGYGLQVYDQNVDPKNPQPLLTIPMADVRDVVVWEGKIYVAAGENGVYIVGLKQVSLPTVAPTLDAATTTPQPTPVPQIEYTLRGLPEQGEANSVAFFASYRIVTRVQGGRYQSDEYDPQRGPAGVTREPVRNDYLFVADGPAGITVFDLTRIRGGTPTPMPFTEPEGDVQAIWISYNPVTQSSYWYAYVAAGAQGLLVCDVSKPEEISIVDQQSLGRGVRALDVAALAGHAYVAAGPHGLYIFDVRDPKDIQQVGHFTDGIHDGVYAVGVYKKYIFLAAGQDGVIVLQVNNPEKPERTEDGYKLDWGENSARYALDEFLDTHDLSKRTVELLLRILLDTGLAALALFVSLMVFAGFVLPADSPMQRFRALGRMFQSFFGGHPAAWFIDDGEVHPRSQQHCRQHGLGVAVVDAGSAAVFVNHKQRWQLAGPGMCFVSDDDCMLGAVDLRRQAMVVGPRLGEDPFAWRAENESRAAYRARQYRRQATIAQTKDGVEIVATLRVIFSLDGQAVEDGTQFGYDRGHITRSVASENLPATERRRPGRVPWLVQETLSAILRKLWADHIGRYTLDELFSPLDGEGIETGLQHSLRRLHAHLTQAEVRGLDEQGAEAGLALPSREFRTLYGRGVHVHGVSLEAIHYTVQDEQQVARRWREDWPEHTAQEKQRLDAQDEQDSTLAYAQILAANLAERIRNLLNPPSLEESLRLLLEASRDAAPPDSDEKRQVEEIIDDLDGEPQ